MNYEMGGTTLSKTAKEKDLGVTMNAVADSGGGLGPHLRESLTM